LKENSGLQEEGFRWLATLAHWGVGACLADDMGLGKTVQALAVLLTLAAEGPILVVAPLSVVANWEEEAARFARDLQCDAFGPGDRRPCSSPGADDLGCLVAGLRALAWNPKGRAGTRLLPPVGLGAGPVGSLGRRAQGIQETGNHLTASAGRARKGLGGGPGVFRALDSTQLWVNRPPGWGKETQPLGAETSWGTPWFWDFSFQFPRGLGWGKVSKEVFWAKRPGLTGPKTRVGPNPGGPRPGGKPGGFPRGGLGIPGAPFFGWLGRGRSFPRKAETVPFGRETLGRAKRATLEDSGLLGRGLGPLKRRQGTTGGAPGLTERGRLRLISGRGPLGKESFGRPRKKGGPPTPGNCRVV